MCVPGYCDFPDTILLLYALGICGLAKQVGQLPGSSNPPASSSCLNLPYGPPHALLTPFLIPEE